MAPKGFPSGPVGNLIIFCEAEVKVGYQLVVYTPKASCRTKRALSSSLIFTLSCLAAAALVNNERTSDDRRRLYHSVPGNCNQAAHSGRQLKEPMTVAVRPTLRPSVALFSSSEEFPQSVTACLHQDCVGR